ncbi:MAG: hypothetical protein ORN53_00650 [Crocinitomicaceae bacterium]|nr:hypothetical protein [Crocinitomicaceae bacterium]
MMQFFAFNGISLPNTSTAFIALSAFSDANSSNPDVHGFWMF